MYCFGSQPLKENDYLKDEKWNFCVSLNKHYLLVSLMVSNVSHTVRSYLQWIEFIISKWFKYK